MTKQELVLAHRGRPLRGRGALGHHPGRLLQVRGKRVFQMAPIHHHFELLGWAESRMIIALLDPRHPLRPARALDAEAAMSAAETSSGTSAPPAACRASSPCSDSPAAAGARRGAPGPRGAVVRSGTPPGGDLERRGRAPGRGGASWAARPAAFLSGADWLAISPGVPPDCRRWTRRAPRASPVLAEIELAYRIADEAPGRDRWIAVTGTNGKSTTTTWIAETSCARRAAGRPRGGNIGSAALALSAGAAAAATSSARCPRSSSRRRTSFRPHVAA